MLVLALCKKTVFLRIAGLFFVLPNALLALGVTHPATISQGPDSVAMQLHYPPKERAAQSQGVVKFYCEVSADGKASHISTLYGKGQARLRTAVEFALRHGRFSPANVDGKPVLGGTILFMMISGKPTIAVALATAESDNVAALSNYVQPQMIDSDALFRRKIFALRDKYTLRYTAHPGAVVIVHVDAQGKQVSKKIKTESPPMVGTAGCCWMWRLKNDSSRRRAMVSRSPVTLNWRLILSTCAIQIAQRGWER